jgi:hypothetical protein
VTRGESDDDTRGTRQRSDEVGGRDLRQRQRVVIRDSLVEALAEGREACAQAAEAAVRSFGGDPINLKTLAAHVVAAIRARSKSG